MRVSFNNIKDTLLYLHIAKPLAKFLNRNILNTFSNIFRQNLVGRKLAESPGKMIITRKKWRNDFLSKETLQNYLTLTLSWNNLLVRSSLQRAEIYFNCKKHQYTEEAYSESSQTPNAELFAEIRLFYSLSIYDFLMISGKKWKKPWLAFAKASS